jgi:hypothetical protein
MLQFLITVLLSVSAVAKDSCAVLMENDVGGKFQDSPEMVALFQAQQWLVDYGRDNPSSDESVSLYRSWQRWNTINDQQRDHTLALELKLISPPAEGNLFLWNGQAKLNELSKANLKRMLLQLKARHHQFADSGFEQPAADAARLVRLSYSLSLPARPLDGVTPPLPAPRELLKAGLQSSSEDYYSTLLSGSPSAAFRMKLNSGSARGTAIYLRDDVARTQGFVVPHFDNIESVMAFFATWDSEALDRLVRYNRMSLPFSVKTGHDLLDYFEFGAIGMDQVFPPGVPEKLSVLRERLKDYVLTEQDAHVFVREAFQLYAASLALTKPASYSRLTSALRSHETILPGDRLFREFFAFIGIPGLDVRVPVAARASDYSIEREAPKTQGFREPFHGLNSFQRRVDHNSKP